MPEYWVADPEERVVRVWRFAEGAREPERVTERLAWRPAGAGEPLVLELGEVLRGP